MRIAHLKKKKSMTTLSHAGETFEADVHGAFDVPEEVAEWLTSRFPHLYGEAEPAPVTEQPAAPADDTVTKAKTTRGAKQTAPVEPDPTPAAGAEVPPTP